MNILIILLNEGSGFWLMKKDIIWDNNNKKLIRK